MLVYASILDHFRDIYLAYRLAPMSMTLIDLEDHSSCLRPY